MYVVKLNEVLRENGIVYFVFEYVEKNLYQYLKGQPKLLPELTVHQLTLDMLNGLDYMHRHGFFHRDLKPENLLITQSNPKREYPLYQYLW